MDQDRQPDRSEMPEFDLPPWGSGGAPAYVEPPVSAPAPDTEPGAAPIVVTVDRIEGARRTLGLVAGEGSHPVGDDPPARAVGVARAAAVERLVEAAAEMGATAVVGAGFSLAATEDMITVLATGTAVTGTLH